jgi:hypothetical protein
LLPPFSEIKGFPDDFPQHKFPTAIMSVRIARSSKTPFKEVHAWAEKMNLPHQLNS